MTENYTSSQQAMIDLFEKHVQAELKGDIETTMATMSAQPHLNHVPTMAGGVGRDEVKHFYTTHLVGKFFPPGVKFETVSRTVGISSIVDEMVITFEHTAVIDWMLPGIPITGKKVEVAFVVIVGFEEGKISYEHIHWDQATVLVQLGLLDPTGLPVSGADSARKVLDPTLPSRII